MYCSKLEENRKKLILVTTTVFEEVDLVLISVIRRILATYLHVQNWEAALAIHGNNMSPLLSGSQEILLFFKEQFL